MKNLTRKDLIIAGIVLFLVIVCAKFISIISSILLMGGLALIFSTILNRPVSALAKKGCNRTIATFICLFLLIGFIILATAIIVPQVSKESKAIKKNFPEFQQKLEAKLDVIAEKEGIDIKHLEDNAFIKDKIQKALPHVLSGATKLGASVIGCLIHTIVIILLMVYILCDPKPLIKGFLDPWSFGVKKSLRRCLLRIEKMLFAWAFGLCCGMLCMFLLTWLGLSLIKMEGAFLFAIIAGFLNIIPTLGPFLAAVLPVFITLVTKPIQVIYVLIIYIGMHQIESHVMTPLIMKKQLDIHPMILILAILVMFMFFGMVGAFITAPVMATISIIYDEFVIIPRKYKEKSLN
ncbi:MAG: AI-2E family transporter [Abditibacteriota bacterium]|nr:AI-2E family transporter [Abditibacteriota bacterium]